MVECGASQRCVEYITELQSDHMFTHHPRHRFMVPGAHQTWRWGFYSCNGFHEAKVEAKAGGIQALWHDAVHKHKEVQQRTHACMCGVPVVR